MFNYKLTKNPTLQYQYLSRDSILALEMFTVEVFEKTTNAYKKILMQKGYEEFEITISTNYTFNTINSKFFNVSIELKIQTIHYTEIIKRQKQYQYFSLFYDRKLNESGVKVYKLISKDIESFKRLK